MMAGEEGEREKGCRSGRGKLVLLAGDGEAGEVGDLREARSAGARLLTTARPPCERLGKRINRIVDLRSAVACESDICHAFESPDLSLLARPWATPKKQTVPGGDTSHFPSSFWRYI